jgi:YggT family protein
MLGHAIQLIFGTVISFFAAAFLIRFLMQAYRVSFAGQLGQFVTQVTNWLVKPLRRVIPGLRGFDLASLVAAYLAELLGLTLSLLVENSGMLSLLSTESIALYLLWGALVGLLRLVVYLFIGALIVQAVLSWVNPYSPIARPLAQFTGPILDPIRRVIPPIAGVDLSPFVVLLLAQLVLMFL